MDLQLAINERYFNEGYDEINMLVVVDNLKQTANSWDFELYEDSDWDADQDYPRQDTWNIF